MSASDDEQQKSCTSMVRKVLNNITVEPLVICWLLPFAMTYAAIENMNFEKACRELVNPSSNETQFSKNVCELFVKKDELGINCDGDNVTQFSASTLNVLSENYAEIYSPIKDVQGEVYKFLCAAEQKVQEKLATINAIRNPISSFGPLIIILFAGPWSDKKNLRVPCMLVPFIGEAVGYFCNYYFLN
jgi:PCFT/HCP family folate transporter-like MFS transporter 1/3